MKELFKEILEVRDCEVVEMEIAKDHVHIFASIPPRYSIGETVRVLKSGKRERDFLDDIPRLRRNSGVGEFWKTDICPNRREIGSTGETIKRYIEYHRHEEKTSKQLDFDF